MRPGDHDCLALAERGATRHPLDRALLLAAVADPQVPWADRPLGARDACLLALRREWFGSSFDAVLACPACSELLSLRVDLRRFAAAPGSDEPVRIRGLRFRLPTTRDLAAISDRLDVEEAMAELLRRIAIDGLPEGGHDGWQAELDAALDAADPLADVTLDMACGHCGHAFAAPLDIATALWDELAAHAAGVVEDVHLLASAYGWTEAQILALSPARRALYKQRVLA